MVMWESSFSSKTCLKVQSMWFYRHEDEDVVASRVCEVMFQDFPLLRLMIAAELDLQI